MAGTGPARTGGEVVTTIEILRVFFSIAKPAPQGRLHQGIILSARSRANRSKKLSSLG